MPENIKPLTSLRFYAAAWVVLFSYWENLAGAGAAPRVVAKGYLGVELFFVLSGFILSHVYLQSFGERRLSYGKFLWARLARIYPLHLATLAGIGVMGAAALLLGIGMRHPIVELSSLPANLTLTHAWGLAQVAAWNHPSWSISAEWFAYLAFPAFAAGAWALRERPRLALALTAAGVVAANALYLRLTGELLTQATIVGGAVRIVPSFAYGCGVYLLWRSGFVSSRRAAMVGAALSAGLALGLAQVGAADSAVVVTFGAVILSLAGLCSTGSRLLTGPVSVYLGEVSFAVYMVAIPWQLGFVNLSEKLLGLQDGKLPAPLWLVLTLGVVPVAMAAHHIVEKPARSLLRSWAESRQVAAASRRHAV